MDKELHILILEDNPTDAELEEYELRKVGVKFTSEIVDTKEAFLKTLDESIPDLILADYDLPTFNGLEALKIVKEKCPDVPFILVTGRIGEEFAIETLKKGVTDYVMKGNLKRLVPSINRALEEAKLKEERKLAEDARFKAMALFSGFAEASQYGMGMADLEGTILYVNSTLVRMLGETSVANCMGKHFPTAYYPTSMSRKLTEEVMPAMLRDGHWHGELELRTVDGRRVPTDENYFIIRDEHGRPKYIADILTDITERKRAEEALREREEQYRMLFELASDGIFIHDLDGNFLEVNSAACELSGYSREELLSMNVRDIDTEATGVDVQKRIRQIAEGGRFSFEAIHRRKNGSIIYYDVSSHTTDYGGISAIMTIARDITERKRTEKELQKLNRTLRALSDSSHSMMHAKDEASYLNEVCRIIVEDCEHALVWIGYAEQDINKTVRPVAYAGFEAGYIESMKITWADLERGRGPVGTAIRTGKPSFFRNIVSDPLFTPWREEALRRGYAAVIGVPLMSEGKAFGSINIYSRFPDPFSEEEVRLLTNLADDLAYGISAIRFREARVLSEKALRESEEGYRSLFDNMLNGFAYCRMLFEQDRPKDFIYLHVNKAFETLTGLRNVVGKKVSEVIPGIQESDPGLLEIYGRVALTGISERFETYVESLKMWFLTSVYSPQKEYFVAVFDVITDRKRAEVRITHLNRVYAMLSKINESIVRISDRQQLFETACRIAVEHGLFRLAWIGIVEPETLIVKPVAFYGHEEGYLDIIQISAREMPEGCGPTGSTIREGIHLICNDIQNDQRMLPWRDEALKRGYRSSAAFPLKVGGIVIGALNIYSAESHYFSEEEIKLLDEVTEDISFAVDFLAKEGQRKQAEEALSASEAELHDNYFAQTTINMILSESLGKIPIEVFLQKTLNMVLSVPWIAFEPIGSISLVEDGTDGLVMKAQSNIPVPLKNLCIQVPFGKCLCGQAALTQKVEFADHIDERHEICYEGMHPHGHYSVPILSNGKTLGVLNLYLKEGHIRNPKEEDFLRHVADTLAEIIMRKKAEDRVEYLAYFDNLTGLPNRNLFIDRLTQGIARADYHNKLVAVLTLDIDRFKSINDTYGLEAGDVVLKAVAKMLTQSVREGDTVARIGGDGFGILLIDIAQSEDIILVVEKIMKNVSQTILFGGKEIVLTISGGISAHPHDGKDASVLLKNADMALARAKQEGRKNYQFYTEGMDVKASEFVLMEKNLFNAIKNEEFILYYQPYWDINTKKIAGMEALIRWKSSEFGLVSPGKFIPVLEDTRMIIGVGEWILRTAIRQVKDWQDKGYPVVPVSVNLSLIQFRQKDIAQMIEKIIRETGFSPSLLTLEITESAFMQDIEITRHDLENLKNIGVSISIDDFGTGYSSLAHLKRFPIDNLKIDISFIREIATDPDTASIVTAIIAMAHTLNLKTIAEGIETEEQWKILRLLRCDMGQGYFFSRPLPAEEAERMLI